VARGNKFFRGVGKGEYSAVLKSWEVNQRHQKKKTPENSTQGSSCEYGRFSAPEGAVGEVGRNVRRYV